MRLSERKEGWERDRRREEVTKGGRKRGRKKGRRREGRMEGREADRGGKADFICSSHTAHSH